MNKYWSRRLAGLVPYTPGEQPRDGVFIKLNTNENPYPPSPRAIAAMKDSADADLRLYPDPTCRDLRAALSDFYRVTPEEVFAGNGSDEVLAFAFPAFFDPARPILFADITYSFYPVYANFFGIAYKTLPLDAGFGLPVDAFCQKSGGVLLANPNAPTGKAVTLSDIEKILAADSERVVIVDEAYVDFGAESAVPLIRKYSNLLVVQTLSKSRALAGLRVGYALGDRGLIRALETVKNAFNSYTIDRTAQRCAAEAIRDTAYFCEICENVAKTRDKTAKRLKDMGFRVLDSKANFLFISHERKHAKALLRALRAAGILVRWFDHPRIDNFLRVTIGSPAEMDAFCEKIEAFVR